MRNRAGRLVACIALTATLAASAVAAGTAADQSLPGPVTPLAPAEFAARHHDAATIAGWLRYGGPPLRGDEQRHWRDDYLSAPTPRAMVVAEQLGVAFTHSGHGSAALAEGAAMESCTARIAGTSPPDRCVTYAVDSGIVWPQRAWSLPQLGQAIGPFTPRPDYVHRGPAAARGILVWSHGYGGAHADGRGVAAHGYVNGLNTAGWDVLRFDRPPDQDGHAYRQGQRLRDGLPALEQAGYGRILLAGQSRGAWQSLDLLESPAAAARVAAVIATAPARHGSRLAARNNHHAMLDDWRRLLRLLPDGAATRIAILLFEDDEFDVDPAARAALARAHLAAKGIPHLVLHVTDPDMAGHFGGMTLAFRARYGTCLGHFVETGSRAGACAEAHDRP